MLHTYTTYKCVYAFVCVCDFARTYKHSQLLIYFSCISSRKLRLIFCHLIKYSITTYISMYIFFGYKWLCNSLMHFMKYCKTCFTFNQANAVKTHHIKNGSHQKISSSKFKLSAADLFKYVWLFSEHQALKGWKPSLAPKKSKEKIFIWCIVGYCRVLIFKNHYQYK